MGLFWEAIAVPVLVIVVVLVTLSFALWGTWASQNAAKQLPVVGTPIWNLLTSLANALMSAANTIVDPAVGVFQASAKGFHDFVVTIFNGASGLLGTTVTSLQAAVIALQAQVWNQLTPAVTAATAVAAQAAAAADWVEHAEVIPLKARVQQLEGLASQQTISLSALAYALAPLIAAMPGLQAALATLPQLFTDLHGVELEVAAITQGLTQQIGRIDIIENATHELQALTQTERQAIASLAPLIILATLSAPLLAVLRKTAECDPCKQLDGLQPDNTSALVAYLIQDTQ
jgi:hypothetical protein